MLGGGGGDGDDDDDDGRTTTMSAADLHSLYHEQMKEIQSEREAVFGKSDDDETKSSGPEDLGRTAEAYLAPAKDDEASRPPQPPSTPPPPPPPAWRVPTSSSSSSPSPSPSPTDDATTDATTPPPPRFLPPGWDAEEAYADREALYGFTDEEREAWTTDARRSAAAGPSSSAGGGDEDGGRNAAADEYFARLAGVRRAAGTPPPPSHPPSSSSSSSSSSYPFSHLNPREDGAAMVDVGGKIPSRRIAIARSVVVFPPEVMSAFRLIGRGGGKEEEDGRGGGGCGEETREMIGPKGPIFETARIAGIMGAK